jgi:hypothetical protein
MSCSRMTDGTHTSFIMTAGGLDRALAGPVSSNPAHARGPGHSMRTKCCDGQMEVFYCLFLGSYVINMHVDDKKKKRTCTNGPS